MPRALGSCFFSVMGGNFVSQGFKRLSALILGIVLAFVQSCTSRTRDSEVVDTLRSQLQDWPALSHYHEANAQLPPPTQDEARVVFFGDSITASWNDPQKSGGFFPGKPYLNRGISSQTTPQMLIRFQPDVIALKPRVVVILAGTNDIGGVTGPTSLRAIEDNLTSMAILARAHDIRVVMSSILPTHDTGREDGQPIVHSKNRPPEHIKALNEWMKDLAARQGDIYLDYHSAMVDDRGHLRQELSDDGIHPNRRGYAVMAPLVEQAIAAAMENRA